MNNIGFLGNIVGYQVSSGDSTSPLDITRAGLEKVFSELGLNPEFIPPSIKEVDAFRTASAMIKDEYPVGDEKVRLAVQEVRKSETSVVRHVIRTATDRTGRVTSSRVAEILFGRPKRRNVGRQHGTATLEIWPHSALEGVDKEHVVDVLDLFEGRYNMFKQQFVPASIRFLVRAYLIYLDSVPLPSLGGWFLPSDREKDLRALQEMIRRLGPHCAMDIIPVPDLPEVRGILRRDAEEALVGQVELITKSIGDWLVENPDRPVQVWRIDTWRNDLRGIRAREEEYGRLLEAPLPIAVAAVNGAVRLLRGLEIAQELD